MADYAAQAIINTVLSNAFPDDPIIGEEDASDLRPSSSSTSTTNTKESGGGGGGDALCARVVELADDILAQPPLFTDSEFDPSVGGGGDGGGGERAEWGLGRRWGAEALLKAIDRGKYAGGRTGRTLRFFCVAFHLSSCVYYGFFFFLVCRILDA